MIIHLVPNIFLVAFIRCIRACSYHLYINQGIFMVWLLLSLSTSATKLSPYLDSWWMKPEHNRSTRMDLLPEWICWDTAIPLYKESFFIWSLNVELSIKIIRNSGYVSLTPSAIKLIIWSFWRTVPKSFSKEKANKILA